MASMRNDELLVFIKKQFSLYRKPENKTPEFQEKLLKNASSYPSGLWATHAPTKKLRYAFDVVAASQLAHRSYASFTTGQDSLKTVASLCYECCLIRDKPPFTKIDTKFLDQWKAAFAPVLDAFMLELHSTVAQWEAWRKMSQSDQSAQIEMAVPRATGS